MASRSRRTRSSRRGLETSPASTSTKRRATIQRLKNFQRWVNKIDNHQARTLWNLIKSFNRLPPPFLLTGLLIEWNFHPHWQYLCVCLCWWLPALPPSNIYSPLRKFIDLSRRAEKIICSIFYFHVTAIHGLCQCNVCWLNIDYCVSLLSLSHT